MTGEVVVPRACRYTVTRPHKASRKWLRGYRLAYGQVIPPEARVNPDEFPQEEYPVYCPDCDYLLRGLPDNHRCPECGRSFERGRLLVEQYAMEGGKRHWRRINKYAKWTLVIAIILQIIPMLALSIPSLMISIFGPVNFFHLVKVALAVMTLAIVLLCVSLYLSLRGWRLSHKKCKKIYEAIDQTGPSFVTAKRYNRMLRVTCVLLFLSGWFLGFYGDADYYLARPERTLIPLLLALIIVGLGYATYRLFRCRHR